MNLGMKKPLVTSCSNSSFCVILYCLVLFIVQRTYTKTHTSAAMTEHLTQECGRSRPNRLAGAAISSVVERPPLKWKVGCSIHGHWATCRSAAWARAFTSAAPTKSIIQATAAANCR